jgi:quercetin dioxygenase-like cupin family protein
MKMQKKSMNTPDETRNFPNGNAQLVMLEGTTFALVTFEPGWRWSESLKPIAQTESCQVLHTMYHLSGKLHVVMDDGTEEEYGPGDISLIPAGHDAWTVGDEPALCLDINGLASQA